MVRSTKPLRILAFVLCASFLLSGNFSGAERLPDPEGIYPYAEMDNFQDDQVIQLTTPSKSRFFFGVNSI